MPNTTSSPAGLVRLRGTALSLCGGAGSQEGEGRGELGAWCGEGRGECDECHGEREGWECELLVSSEPAKRKH